MGKKVLIIDDDPDVILFISTLLKDHNYETIDAYDGVEGLTKARTENPDLVLLDLMMPRRSGIAVLGEMKRDAQLRKIPIIMVTGVAGETGIDLEAFLKRSMGKGGPAIRPDGYVEKPIDPEKLLNIIREKIG